jgi:hypothetical protein
VGVGGDSEKDRFNPCPLVVYLHFWSVTRKQNTVEYLLHRRPDCLQVVLIVSLGIDLSSLLKKPLCA